MAMMNAMIMMYVALVRGVMQIGKERNFLPVTFLLGKQPSFAWGR